MIEQTENIELITETNKKTTIAPIYTSEENALILEIDNSGLNARNARNKYTHRKHWLEYSPKRGYRHCSSSFDSRRRTWCKAKKGTYNQFLGMRLTSEIASDNNLITFGFCSSGYANEETRDKMNTYALNESQRSKVNKLLNHGKALNDLYSKAIDEANEKQKPEAKDMSEYKFNSLYRESEIAKCTSDLDLIVFRVEGKGIKKRCRKAERIFENVGYIIASPDQTREESATKFIDDILLTSQAKSKLSNFREINSAYITAKKCTLNARKGDSPFYGMREMLMEKPIIAKILEVNK